MDTGIFGRWGESYFGRPEDQPLISAVLLVLIALTPIFWSSANRPRAAHPSGVGVQLGP
jgi:hypothetical protein